MISVALVYSLDQKSGSSDLMSVLENEDLSYGTTNVAFSKNGMGTSLFCPFTVEAASFLLLGLFMYIGKLLVVGTSFAGYPGSCK